MERSPFSTLGKDSWITKTKKRKKEEDRPIDQSIAESGLVPEIKKKDKEKKRRDTLQGQFDEMYTQLGVFLTSVKVTFCWFFVLFVFFFLLKGRIL